MTPDQFEQGMALLLAHWHREAPPVESLTIYAAALGHLPLDLWQAAVYECITTSTFFPRVGELLTAAAQALMARDGHSEQWARTLLAEHAPPPAILFPAVEPPTVEQTPQVQASRRGDAAQITEKLVRQLTKGS